MRSRKPASFPMSVALTLASRWAMLLCTIASGVVVARVLGPGEKGLFVLTYLLLNQTVSVGNFANSPFICALNFSNCMTFSMRASRKALVSDSSSVLSVNQRISVAE